MKRIPGSGATPLSGGLQLATAPYGGPPPRAPIQPQYEQQYPPRAQLPEDRESTAVLTILGVVAALATVLEFISAFLPWVMTGGVSVSGINLMTSSGYEADGFFMIRWGWGGILFTGFFALFFGAFMLIPVILFLLNKPSGASWAIVLGVLAFFTGLVNVIMIYATLETSSVGAGLWAMFASAIVMLICGIVGMRVSE
jgi:hypothetical protein